MNQILKILLIVFVIIYVVSPLDMVPGPIDDVIVAILGIAAQKAITDRKAQE